MSKRKDVLWLGILVILVIGSFSFSAFAQEESLSIIESIDNSNSAKFIPGQLVVGLEKPDPSFNDKVTLHGGQLINSIEEINAFVVKVPINAEDKFISAISSNPNVSYVEREAIMTALYSPNDTFYSAQWGMQRIGMEQVWQPNFALGSGIIVAVVDTGIYPDHPDFAGTNILTNSDWDFVDGDADTRPTKICNRFHSAEFHATFVAGIIAATSDNGVGVAGIGPFDILPVRVLDHCGSGSSSAVANGILWAKNNGADVINLSLGSSSPSTVILNAVNAAHTADVIIVSASGNDGNDSPTPRSLNEFIIYKGKTIPSITNIAKSNEETDKLTPEMKEMYENAGLLDEAEKVLKENKKPDNSQLKAKAGEKTNV